MMFSQIIWPSQIPFPERATFGAEFWKTVGFWRKKSDSKISSFIEINFFVSNSEHWTQTIRYLHLISLKLCEEVSEVNEISEEGCDIPAKECSAKKLRAENSFLILKISTKLTGQMSSISNSKSKTVIQSTLDLKIVH